MKSAQFLDHVAVKRCARLLVGVTNDVHSCPNELGKAPERVRERVRSEQAGELDDMGDALQRMYVCKT